MSASELPHSSSADVGDEEVHALLATSSPRALPTGATEGVHNRYGAEVDAHAGTASTDKDRSDAASALPVAAPTAAPPVSSSTKARSLAAGQVNRIIDGALPEGMSISRDARIALQKCATISLLYLACLADAERKAAGSSRTTLNVQDIRSGMEAAGMKHLLPLMSTAAKRARD